MKIQTSRESHRTDRRYAGVYQQQGRMITDADWNELMDIVIQRRREALGDVVQYGVPRDGGLRIDSDLTGGLKIIPGHLYAGGVLARLPGTEPVDYATQPDFPAPPALPAGPDAYVVYADVWDRTIISLEDAELRDAALHGADTCARAQTVVQIKWCAGTLNPEDPTVNPVQGDASLSLRLRRTRAVADPCDPCTSAELGEDPSRVGNYLFRVEVHDAEWDPATKKVTRLTLKWSSENGAEQYALNAMPAGFRSGDWAYEFLNDVTERHLGVHLADAADFPQRGLLVTAYPEDVDTDVYRYVRRWDGFVTLSRSGGGWTLDAAHAVDRGQALAEGGDAAADGYVTLTSQFTANLRSLVLKVKLDGHVFVAGDYWTGAVREEIHAVSDTVLAPSRPTGIAHRYLTLGRVTFEANGGPPHPELADPLNDAARRRLEFPSLTTLKASDVGFVATDCPGLYANAENVQQALDNLCDIDASDIAYADPACAPVPNGGPTVWSLLQAAITSWPDLDADARTTVKDVLDALMCRLDAAKIPYDPTVKRTKWQDITEAPLGTPPQPNTVQGALDSLVENLESSDIGYTIPACTPAAGDPPPFRDLLGLASNDVTNVKALWDLVLCRLNAGHVPFANLCSDLFGDADNVGEALNKLCDLSALNVGYDVPPCGTTDAPSVRSELAIAPGAGTVGAVLSRLLCDLNATDVPVEKNADLAPALGVTSVRTVQDALNLLATGLGGGCAATVGVGGTYGTLDEAFTHLAAQPVVTLCLLPGTHVVAAPLAPAARTSIKLSGAGGEASVIQLRGSLSLIANEIILHDLGVRCASPKAGLSLAGTTVRADGCAFDRDPSIEIQGPIWVKNFQGTSTEFPRAIAVDSRDGVVIMGHFSGTMNLGGVPLTAAAADLFLAKFSTKGEHQWSRSFAGLMGQSLAVDSEDGVVITGQFSGTVEMEGAVLKAVGPADLFIIKFDANGRHVWSHTFEGSGTQNGLMIAMGRRDSLALTGQFTGTMKIGDEVLRATTPAVPDVFIARFDSRGKFAWARSFAGSATATGYGAAVDNQDNMVVAGFFEGTVDFGGGPMTAALTDLFAAKFDANGKHVWSQGFKGTDRGAGLAIALDSKDNVLLTGYIKGTVDFGGGPLTAEGTDLFVAKLDTRGKHLWSNNFKGVGIQIGFGIAVDSRDSVVLTGYYTGTVDFGGGLLTAKGSNDLFVAKLDAAGKHVWSDSFGAAGGEIGQAIAVDHQDNVVLTGYFSGSVAFGDTTLTAVGPMDLFIFKLAIPGPFEPIALIKPKGTEPSELHWTANRMAGLETVLAIANYRVGGVISGNTIAGIVSLLDGLNTPLTVDNEQIFKGPTVPKFVEGGALRLECNRLGQVVSRFSVPNTPQAFKSIHATDNIFSEMANTFIGANVTMNGNQFIHGKALTTESVAVVVCRYPIFVGNQVLVTAQIDVSAAEVPQVAANSPRLAFNRL